MNIHLFKNVSEGNLIEIKQRKIIKALNDIITLNPKRFKKFNGILKDNKNNSREKSSVLNSEIKNDNNTNIKNEVIYSYNNTKNNLFQSRNKRFILKKGINKFHSSRSDIIFNKDKSKVFSNLKKNLNNKELFKIKTSNRHFEILNSLKKY